MFGRAKMMQDMRCINPWELEFRYISKALGLFWNHATASYIIAEAGYYRRLRGWID